MGFSARLVIFLHLLNLASAGPLGLRDAAPTVIVSQGAVIGVSDSFMGQDEFLGIPFALPPTGDRRLRAPQSTTAAYSSGTLTATSTPKGCPQFTGTTIPATSSVLSSTATVTASLFEDVLEIVDELLEGISESEASEDCLYLDIQRPSGTNASSKLPVLAYIYGGGFETGAISIYNNQYMLGKAMALNTPYVFVAMNYRLGGFGFLGGEELYAEGNTNLGLRDQRLALEWISDNIAAFGGDPEKVTMWGESAGAWSVLDQTIINGGNNTYAGRPLFRGAMMDSGAAFPALDVNDAKPQSIFDGLANDAGCGNVSDKLACLRSVDYDTFQLVQNEQVLPNQAISFTYVARPDPADAFFPLSPMEAILRGSYAKVPVLTGNQEDEGTFFAAFISGVNGSNQTALLELFRPIFPNASASTINDYTSIYPENITLGAPYNTDILNELYPGYKRLSSIIGDLYFTLRRRIYLDTISEEVETWSYTATYDDEIPFLGTCHGTDVLAMYSLLLATPTAIEEMWTRYISFVNFLDPNVIGMNANGSAYSAWPRYNTTTRSLLSFDGFGVSVTPDTFREEAYDYLKGEDSDFKI